MTVVPIVFSQCLLREGRILPLAFKRWGGELVFCMCCGVLGCIYECLLGFVVLFSQNQDHYAVLGLGTIRYRATQKQIKAARKYLSLINITFFSDVHNCFPVKIPACCEQGFYCFPGLKV